MLGLSFTFCRCNRSVGLVILSGFLTCSAISPLYSFEYSDGYASTPKHFEQEWVHRYFNSIDENTDVEEVIDFLISLRESLVSKGYTCPSLAEMCLRMRDYLMEKGIQYNDEEFDELYAEILMRQSQIFVNSQGLPISQNWSPKFKLAKHKDKKDKNTFKMKSKGVFGFLKCVAGGLICIIPVPVVQAVGGGLILNGINDIIDNAREEGDENERLRNLDEQRRKEAQQLETN